MCIELNLALDICVGILSGIISSIVVWFILNIVLTPSLEIEDIVQYKDNRRFVRVRNRSCFDIYEVICRAEYWYGNNKASYKRTNTPISYLEKKHGLVAVLLSGDTYTNDFFKTMNEKSYIIITVTYQNKFGVKKTAKQRINLAENYI